MTSSPVVLQTFALPSTGPWPTADPFLFCVHHNDDYPEGDEEFSPCAPLVGRTIGMDFSARDGWSMYHGSSVPGFPMHPHRGFETISFMRRGLMDHADSLGAAARFGRGDVQWMTAGSGIVHSEMFPLLERDRRNPLELFQIWINLPRSDKMVAPHFSMLWDHTIPKLAFSDHADRATRVTVVAGTLDGRAAPAPPPHSWASRADADVAIWHLRLDPQATFTLPAASGADTIRTLYVFDGEALLVDGQVIGARHGAVVACDRPVEIADAGTGVDVLVLQGRPIAEPVVQYGPFVMSTEGEIRKAYIDYQETGFGGWPWPATDPNHGARIRRFARHADGRTEELEIAAG